MTWKNHIINHMSASQAEKYKCRPQHIVHFTIKTSQPWRIIWVIYISMKKVLHCFYYAEKFLMLKNDSSNYKLYITNCLQYMKFVGKILTNFILQILYFCYILAWFILLPPVVTMTKFWTCTMHGKCVRMCEGVHMCI